MATYYSIVTDIGLAKMTATEAGGPPINLTHLAVGDGIADPAESQTALQNELWRGVCNPPYPHPANSNWMVVEATIPASIGGFTINEVGIFDGDVPTGELIAVGKYPLTTKPAPGSGSEKDLYVRMIFEFSNTATINQTIDPSLVFATKEYVDSRDWRDSVRAATTSNFGDRAYLVVDSPNVNGDVKYASQTSGSSGNDITVAHVDPGLASQALSVSVSGNTITVNLATDAVAAVISSAASVALAVNNDPAASALVSATAAGDGNGIVAAAIAANLANGLDVDGAAPAVLDGVTLAANDRVLVKDMDTGARNGIYFVQTVGTGYNGVWERAMDADTALEVGAGLMVTVEEGLVNNDSIWLLTNNMPINLGADPLNFRRVCGKTGVAAGTFTKLTVNDLGEVLQGENPTTLAEYNIVDAAPLAHVGAGGLVEHPAATPAQAGFMSAADKATLDTIVPPGAIIAFAVGKTLPIGYLECNGVSLNRDTYTDLFDAIGLMYGPGDDSNSFNLPDYRGYFLRGWDHGAGRDPDRLLRMNRGDGSIGDNVGTYQLDQFRAHVHPLPLYYWDGALPLNRLRASYPLSHTATINSNPTGGNETRPLNINVMYCIKY